MTVQFQADANLNQIILLVARRREPGLDFQTAVIFTRRYNFQYRKLYSLPNKGDVS